MGPSPSPGDPDKPANPVFVPPPIQRLSRCLVGLPTPSTKSPLDPPPSLSPQPAPSPLPGPNRAPSITEPSSSRPSTIFPRLHRLEIADDMAGNQKKPPLLELLLSSSSFLDAVATVTDSEQSLYAVETVGASTTVWRSDPWDSSAKIADIRWPKDLPHKGKGRDHAHGAMVQMDDLRWRNTTSLLKYSSLGSARKFYIPHHTHALKWKREGNTFVCSTPTCKGAVAILDSFDSADDTAPRLRVFETLGSFHQSVPQLDHAGISLSLLDHLFVTALLLVTGPEDWMMLSRNPSSLHGRPTNPPTCLAAASNGSASNRQWRKIMYGEPMYPSLKTPALDERVVSGSEDADVLDSCEPPQLSTSARQWRKIIYGEPLYPSLRPQSTDTLDLPPRPSTATSFSSDSACSPHTPCSAPSAEFYDTPSLFDDTERATSRSGIETAQVASPLALSSGTLSPLPSSECIPLSPLRISNALGSRRELPSPPSSYQPPPSFQPWLHRSRSTPRLKLRLSAQSPIPSVDDQDDLTHQGLLTRIASGLNVRQLPTPPQQELHAQPPQPQTRLAEVKRLSQTHQRSLPPTPPLVSRSTSAQQYHVHSLSHDIPSQSPLVPTARRPSTAHQGPSIVAQHDRVAGGRRGRREKDPDEVIEWMRGLARAQRRRGFDEEEVEDPVCDVDDLAYEPPPPAYNAIDFSTPPQARSPLEGTRSRTDLV